MRKTDNRKSMKRILKENGYKPGDIVFNKSGLPIGVCGENYELIESGEIVLGGGFE